MSKQNGTAPQIQRREKWIDLPEEYAGFRIKVWLNAPTKVWMGLTNKKEKKAQEAAKQIVLEHNGWLDFDGEPYPPPSEEAFWEDIPTELAASVFAAANAEMSDLPNSIATRKRRSRRG